MVTLSLTPSEINALYAVLNITGKFCEHINEPSIEAQAALESGMDKRDLEVAIMEIWRMTDRARKEGDAGE